MGIQVNDLTNNFNHSLIKRRIIMFELSNRINKQLHRTTDYRRFANYEQVSIVTDPASCTPHLPDGTIVQMMKHVQYITGVKEYRFNEYFLTTTVPNIRGRAVERILGQGLYLSPLDVSGTDINRMSDKLLYGAMMYIGNRYHTVIVVDVQHITKQLESVVVNILGRLYTQDSNKKGACKSRLRLFLATTSGSMVEVDKVCQSTASEAELDERGNLKYADMNEQYTACYTAINALIALEQGEVSGPIPVKSLKARYEFPLLETQKAQVTAGSIDLATPITRVYGKGKTAQYSAGCYHKNITAVRQEELRDVATNYYLRNNLLEIGRDELEENLAMLEEYLAEEMPTSVEDFLGLPNEDRELFAKIYDEISRLRFEMHLEDMPRYSEVWGDTSDDTDLSESDL